jgi:hypothetical protein
MTTFLGVAYLLQRFQFVKVPGEAYTLEPVTQSQVIHVPHEYNLGVVKRCAT